MAKKLKTWFGVIIAIIGFISSVTGIMGWLEVSFRLGTIIVPNPIIVILAMVIALILWVAAFVLGGVYVLYMLLSGLMKTLMKAIDLSKLPVAHEFSAIPETPAPEHPQMQEQIMK